MFSPDGKLVFIASDDSALLTPWRRSDLLDMVCSVVKRNLNRNEWTNIAPDEPYRPICPDIPIP